MPKTSSFIMTAKYLRESAKKNGMNFLPAIAEIIDNSISANATQIKIEIKPQSETLCTLIISDNGKGMDSETLTKALTSYGYVGEYDSKSISFYGTGVKNALFYLSSAGKVTYTSIHNNMETKLWFTLDENAGEATTEDSVKSLLPTGTTVEITNVEFNLEKELEDLRRFLSVTYFPKYAENKNFFILCPDITKNNSKTSIKFEDPLYSTNTKNKNGLDYFNKLEETALVNDTEVKISGYIFNKNAFTEEDFIDWDSTTKLIGPGRKKSYGFTSDRSGVFFKCGDRFATLGSHNFLFWKSQYDTVNLRICVEVPHSLFNKFLQVNKSLVQLSELGLDDFKKKIMKIYHEHDRSLEKPTVEIKDDSENEQLLNELNEGLKKSYDKNPLERPDFQALIPEEPKAEVKEHQGGTKNRPSGLKYKNQYFDLIYEHRGNRATHYQASRVNNKLLIKLNVDHPYIQNFIKKGQKDKKQALYDIYAEYIALVDAQANNDFSSDCFYEIIENKAEQLRKLYA